VKFNIDMVLLPQLPRFQVQHRDKGKNHANNDVSDVSLPSPSQSSFMKVLAWAPWPKMKHGHRNEAAEEIPATSTGLNFHH
jgi:hypothetical protein